MVKEIQLNDTPIQIDKYKEDLVNGLHKISVGFKVTSEEYHDIAMLLYKETFDISVPERELNFRGRIINYFTSITNLYEKDKVGNYCVTLKEIKE